MHLVQIDPELECFHDLGIGQVILLPASFISRAPFCAQRPKEPLRGADIAGNADTPALDPAGSILLGDGLAIGDHFIPGLRYFFGSSPASAKAFLFQ